MLLPPISQLAVTACLEHFTSGYARLILMNPTLMRTVEKMKEPQRSLWRWHALEELEHKTVAFDVYQAVGGSYLTRVVVMLYVAPIFIFRVLKFWWIMRSRRQLPVARSIFRVVKFLFFSPGLLTRFFPHLARWFIPGYHPLQDSDETAAKNRVIHELRYQNLYRSKPLHIDDVDSPYADDDVETFHFGPNTESTSNGSAVWPSSSRL